MPSVHSSGVPMVTEVGLDGKDLGKLELKPGTHQFLLCCHPRFSMKIAFLVSNIVYAVYFCKLISLHHPQSDIEFKLCEINEEFQLTATDCGKQWISRRACILQMKDFSSAVELKLFLSLLASGPGLLYYMPSNAMQCSAMHCCKSNKIVLLELRISSMHFTFAF